jgi:hypothetical protein
MTGITFEHLRCDDIIEAFGKDYIESRWNTLFTEMGEYLKKNGLSTVASVDKFLLTNAVLDSCTDIKRLKDFTKIEKVNSQKIIAYTAYWLLRRKPIQIYNPQAKIDDLVILRELTTLNERFVLQYILDYLSTRERGSHILSRPNEELKNFSGMLLYYLIYRLRDAQSLEMMITAFFAGQVYERTDGDISPELHPYDNHR